MQINYNSVGNEVDNNFYLSTVIKIIQQRPLIGY